MSLDLWTELEKLFEDHRRLTLREARFIKGVSQQTLEEHTGISQPRISMHESSGLRLNEKERRAIENDMNLVNLIKWEGNMETPMQMPAMGGGETNDNVIEAVKAYLKSKHGESGAAQKLKTMSASDLITLADDLKAGKGKKASDKKEVNSMPSMQFATDSEGGE